MKIVEVLIYACLIVGLTIYIYFEKRGSYKEGFSDGIKYHSNMYESLLDHINKLNKEAEEAGMDFTAYVTSIKSSNKTESEDKE